ncbi:MAG: single-stranded DNA-binding protein [bacterium]
MINSVVIVGRAGKDPEIKYFESGKVKTSFSLAVNIWNSATKKEEAHWFNIDLWDKQAERASEYIKKGMLISIEGRLSGRKWKDETGATREIFSIVASNYQILSFKRDAQQQNSF